MYNGRKKSTGSIIYKYEERQMDYTRIIRNTIDLLDKNEEWRERYSNYAKEILENKNNNVIHGSMYKKALGRLIVYSTVSRMKSATSRTRTYGLRYEGQEVAEILVRNNGCYIRTNENNNKTNEKYYGCPESLRLSTCLISDESAQKFVSFFNDDPRRKNCGKKNEEHKHESALLSELEKPSGATKSLKDIQPILLCGARFQMPTPISASKMRAGNPKYASQSGGGIDVLCRRRNKTEKPGEQSHLTVIEVKDSYTDAESPEKAIMQAIAYATFIHRLFTAKDTNAEVWANLFGYSRIPDVSKLKAVIAMPHESRIKAYFDGDEISYGDIKMTLHYLPYEFNNDKVRFVSNKSLL